MALLLDFFQFVHFNLLDQEFRSHNATELFTLLLMSQCSAGDDGIINTELQCAFSWPIKLWGNNADYITATR